MLNLFDKVTECRTKFYKNKRVLVAGGTGTIGVQLTRKLIKLGADVTVVSLDVPSRSKKLFGDYVEYIQADLTDKVNCLKVTAGQEIVFNLLCNKGAASISRKRAAECFIPMILYQLYLMEAAYKNNVERFLFVSSIGAYPNIAIRKEEDLWEGFPKQIDCYAGIAKRIGELQGEVYSLIYDWGAVRIVRPANVYGAYDNFDSKTGQVIPALITRMVSGENPVRIWGFSAVRDFIYSEDVADGMLLALEKLPPCEPVNLGSGIGYTVYRVANIISSYMEPVPEIIQQKDVDIGDSVRVLDTVKAKSLLGFEMQTPIEVGIKQTIDWYRNFLKGVD